MPEALPQVSARVVHTALAVLALAIVFSRQVPLLSNDVGGRTAAALGGLLALAVLGFLGGGRAFSVFRHLLPAIAGLDYFGYCRPARGVGGDSYDFMVLESGVIAISIGDVSGKGIPAALLMASLQSALRGQAM